MATKSASAANGSAKAAPSPEFHPFSSRWAMSSAISRASMGAPSFTPDKQRLYGYPLHVSSTRERILEAARDILEKEGEVAPTMSAIARAAGISRQAVYLH